MIPESTGRLRFAYLLPFSCACLASSALPLRGDPEEEAVARVIKEMKRAPSPKEREKAAAPIRAMGRRAVGPLVRLARAGEGNDTRILAVLGLAELGKDAKEAVPELFRIAKDKRADPHLRLYTMVALRAIKPNWAAEVPFLVAALDDSALQRDALDLLEELGPAAKPAVPALVARINKEGAAPRYLMFLGRIGPGAKAAIPALLRSLGRGKHDDERAAAAEALGRVGAQTKEVVPALGQALGDRDWEVRAAAAQALGRIGPAAKGALPDLTKALKDKKPEVRKSAEEAIAKIKMARAA